MAASPEMLPLMLRACGRHRASSRVPREVCEVCAEPKADKQQEETSKEKPRGFEISCLDPSGSVKRRACLYLCFGMLGFASGCLEAVSDRLSGPAQRELLAVWIGPIGSRLIILSAQPQGLEP